MATFLLALDQATNTTGYAVFKNQKLIAHGYKTFTGNTHVVRMQKLREWVESLILAVDKDIEVVIEDIQLQDINGTVGIPTFKKLAHVQGALLTLFEQYKIKSEIVLATQWRSTCGIPTGRGQNRVAQKAAAQAYVKKTFGIDATEDEADAICLGQHVVMTRDSVINWS